MKRVHLAIGARVLCNVTSPGCETAEARETYSDEVTCKTCQRIVRRLAKQFRATHGFADFANEAEFGAYKGYDDGLRVQGQEGVMFAPAMYQGDPNVDPNDANVQRHGYNKPNVREVQQKSNNNPYNCGPVNGDVHQAQQGPTAHEAPTPVRFAHGKGSFLSTQGNAKPLDRVPPDA